MMYLSSKNEVKIKDVEDKRRIIMKSRQLIAKLTMLSLIAALSSSAALQAKTITCNYTVKKSYKYGCSQGNVTKPTNKPQQNGNSNTNTGNNNNTNNNPNNNINNNNVNNNNTQNNNNVPNDNTNNSEVAVSTQKKMEDEVLVLVNKERAKNGLKALTMDENVRKVARTKSSDMSTKNYFSHTSPTYGSPFDMLKSFGISYKSAGENIAQGYTTAEAVVKGWMNSSGHRANILNANYTKIGIGYEAKGNYWTQMFIG